jgi:hypothetical protein
MVNDLVDKELASVTSCHLDGMKPRRRIIPEFSKIQDMSVDDLMCEQILDRVFISQDAHYNEWASFRHLHLNTAVVRRTV